MQRLLTGKVRLPGFSGAWNKIRLGNVVEFFNGKAHEKCITEKGKYVVVNSKFISSDGKIRKYSNNNLFPLAQKDITMVMSDVPNGRAIAKCYYIDINDKYTLNQRICCLRTKNQNSIFLHYILNRNKYFLQFDDGVGQTNLRRDEILNCSILLPEISEQDAIVKILREADKELKVLENKLKWLCCTNNNKMIV